MFKKIVCILIAFLLIAQCGCAAQPAPLTAAELLSLGEKYLSELDYEQALVQFLKVIEIEPMNPRGYTGAAEAYEGLGDPKNAVAVLEKGIQLLDSDSSIATALEDLTDRLLYSGTGDGDNSDRNAESSSLNGEKTPYSVDDLVAWGYPPNTKLQDVQRKLNLDNTDMERALRGERESNMYLGICSTNDNSLLFAANSEGYLTLLSSLGESTALPEGPRGIKPGMTYAEVVGRFYLENEAARDYSFVKSNSSSQSPAILYEISESKRAYVFPDLFGGMMVLHYTDPDCPYPALMCIFSKDGTLLEFHVEIPVN